MSNIILFQIGCVITVITFVMIICISFYLDYEKKQQDLLREMRSYFTENNNEIIKLINNNRKIIINFWLLMKHLKLDIDTDARIIKKE